MKLEDFKIVFDNPRGVFNVGDEVRGTVCITLNQPMKMRNIKLYFEGKGKSHWEVKQGRNKTDYRAQECYINYTVILFGTGNTKTDHPAGHHIYPFSLRLAPNLPSSFEGKRGYVRYFCKATIDRPWKIDENTKRAFTVIRHLDLNTQPDAGFPVYAEQEESIESCCCSSGTVSAVLMLNKKGFVPGEPITYSIKIVNRCDQLTAAIRLELKQDVTYTGFSSSLFSSGNPKKHMKNETFLLFNSGNGVRPNKNEDLNKTSTIPAVPPSILEGCGIIDIKYSVILTIPVGWSSVEIEKEITIGTIPLHVPNMSVPSYPMVVSPDGMATAPPLEPPPYMEPPPAYEDCVFGGADIRDENDDENTTGLSAWTPAYPYYHWGENGPPGPPPIATAPPPAYNQA